MPKKMTFDDYVARNKFNPEQIALDVANAKTFTQIAKDYNTTGAVLMHFIQSDEDYARRIQEARVSAAQIHLDLALDMLHNAKDPFQITKAKEIASHAKWLAAKLNPTNFGDKVMHEHNAQIDNKIQIVFGTIAEYEKGLARTNVIEMEKDPVTLKLEDDKKPKETALPQRISIGRKAQ